MIDILLKIAVLFITLSILCVIYRLIKGPTISDRILALDMLGINIISGVAVFSVIIESSAFTEVILLIGILAFVSTIAFARFIERGVIFDKGSK